MGTTLAYNDVFEPMDEDKDFGFKDKHNDKICSQTQRVANY